MIKQLSIICACLIWLHVDSFGQHSNDHLPICFKNDSTYIDVPQLGEIRQFVNQFSQNTAFFFLIEFSSNASNIKVKKRNTLIRQCLQRERIDSTRIIFWDQSNAIQSNCIRISLRSTSLLHSYQLHPVFRWFDQNHTYTAINKTVRPIHKAKVFDKNVAYLDIKPIQSDKKSISTSSDLKTLSSLEDLLKIYPLLSELNTQENVYISHQVIDTSDYQWIALHQQIKSDINGGLEAINDQLIRSEPYRNLKLLEIADTVAFFKYSPPPTKPDFNVNADTIQQMNAQIKGLDIRIQYLEEKISTKKSKKKTIRERKALNSIINQKKIILRRIHHFKSTQQRNTKIGLEKYYRDVALYMSKRNEAQNQFIENEKLRRTTLDTAIAYAQFQLQTLQDNGFAQEIIESMDETYFISHFSSNAWLRFNIGQQQQMEKTSCTIQDSASIIQSSVYCLTIDSTAFNIVQCTNSSIQVELQKKEIM